MKKTLLAFFASTLGLAAPWALAQQQQTRTSAFEYDATTGLLVKEIIEPDNVQFCLVTEYEHDTYGNKVSAEIRNCSGASGNALFTSRKSTSAFDAGSGTAGSWSAGQFPTRSTNAMVPFGQPGHQTEYKEYDPRFGKVTRLTGPNGLDTTWTYDGFGRKASETRADGTTTTWTYTICGTCPTHGKYFVTETAAGAPTKNVYFDALNREIRSEVQGFNGTWVRRDTEFDSLGRVYRVSKPYYDGQPVYWTTFTYDILGRVTHAYEPAVDGKTVTTKTVYNGLVTTVSVGNSTTGVGGEPSGTSMPGGAVQVKTTTRNSQGQVVEVRRD